MNRLLAKMFENRGYTEEALDEINSCTHELPKNIDVLCECLDGYRKSQEQIVLVTDFDMDGIMSGVLGFAGLAELGFNAALYFPDTNGYGFDEDDVDRILADYPSVKVIMTADVGINCHKAVAYAESKDIVCLITDHHQPTKPLKTGPYSVCVDPVLDEGDEYFGGICGAHVLYLILKYYAEHYSDEPYAKERIERLRAFAGIATVADRMPLLYENRPIVRDAVDICRFIYSDGNRENANAIQGNPVYRRAFQGLFIMLQAFAEGGKIPSTDAIDEQFFAFYAAPAFNSIKRMTEDISYAYNVFFESSSVALDSMNYILALTDKRKNLEAEAFEKLFETEQPNAPWVYVTDAPAGIRGLLAQRILSMTGEPCVVVGRDDEDNSYEGSGRSPAWFPFIDLTAGLDYAFAAGHNAAFGIKVESEQALSELRTYLEFAVSDNKPDAEELLVKPDFVISTVSENADTDIDIELFEEFVEECSFYKPFGAAFPEPYIELEFEPKEAIWNYLGKDQKHIKVVIPGGLVLLCFNQADMFPDKIDKDKFPDAVSVKGKLNINEYMGNRTVQFLGALDASVSQAADGGVI